MKRKMAAMILGVAVVSLAMNVCAAETTEAVTEAAAEEMRTEYEKMDESLIWGEVTTVDENSVTIVVGDISQQDDKIEASENENQEDTGEAAEVGEEAETEMQEITQIQPEAGGSVFELIEFSEEERTVQFSEDVNVYLVSGDSSIPGILRAAQEQGVLTVDDMFQETDAAEFEETVSETELNEESEEVDFEVSQATLVEADYNAVYAGDLIGVLLDEEGNAETVLIVLPETETAEMDEEAEKTAEE